MGITEDATSCDVQVLPDGAFVCTRREEGVVRGSFALPGNTSAARYLEMLGGLAHSRMELPEPLLFGGTAEGNGPEPFLTVVMRTQGKRLEEIADVLLCLMAQRDDDFELLIVGHKVAPQDQAPLLDVIRSFPASLLERTRYYALDYGTRTAPLQAGFALARGRYVSVLDDDDLVMDTWVTHFKELAAAHDGQMLHSYVVTQEWGVLPGSREGSRHELFAQKTFDPSYCHAFDAAAQLSLNSCPLMGLAFPRFVYQELGLDFDEGLTTTEDWDFLIRVYAVCGVASCNQVSAVYRLWTNAETSHTLHDAREWDKNYALIVDKMNAHPYLFAPGGVEDIRSKNTGSIASRAALLHTAALLVFDEPQPEGDVLGEVARFHAGKLSEMESTSVSAVAAASPWDLAFLFESPSPVSMLAFSPLSCAFEVLGDFKMRLTEVSGTVTELDFAKCAFQNGYQVDCNHIVFLKPNPFVAFELPHAMRLEKVEFSFKLFTNVPDYYIDQVTLGKTGLVAGRAKRWLRRKVRGSE